MEKLAEASNLRGIAATGIRTRVASLNHPAPRGRGFGKLESYH